MVILKDSFDFQPVAPPVPQRQKRRRTPGIDTPTHLRMTGKKVKVRDTPSSVTKKSQLGRGNFHFHFLVYLSLSDINSEYK